MSWKEIAIKKMKAEQMWSEVRITKTTDHRNCTDK